MLTRSILSGVVACVLVSDSAYLRGIQRRKNWSCRYPAVLYRLCINFDRNYWTANLLPVLCCCQSTPSIISRLTCFYLSVTDRWVVLWLQCTQESLLELLLALCLGSVQLKHNGLSCKICQRSAGDVHDFIALPRSMRHAITYKETRVARGMVCVLAHRNLYVKAEEPMVGPGVFCYLSHVIPVDKLPVSALG